MQEVADPAVILEVGLLGKGQRGRGRGALRALGSHGGRTRGGCLFELGLGGGPGPASPVATTGSDPDLSVASAQAVCAGNQTEQGFRSQRPGCFHHRGDVKTHPPTPPVGTVASAPAYLRLGQLVVVVGEPEVEAPSVNVHRGPQESACHGRTFDVPSRTPLQSQTTP